MMLLVVTSTCLADPGALTPFRPSDPLNQAAFEHYYNLDYDAAIQDFERILARHPNDAFAVNHLLSAIQVRELYRMGAMNSGEYSNDSFIGQAHRAADPAQKERIKQLVQRAEKLEDAELASNPTNVDILYARGVTRGQFALYTALIERAWFSALRNAVGARRDHERVLELDAQYTDAKLVVGAHNYVMGSLSFAVKMAVALVGLSGEKDKGLQYLNDAYRGNGETSVDAGVVLMVFLRREHRYGEALQIAARSRRGFRETIFFRWKRRICCVRPARKTRLNSSFAGYGRAVARESTALCITKLQRWDWATCCVARKNIRLRLPLMNW